MDRAWRPPHLILTVGELPRATAVPLGGTAPRLRRPAHFSAVAANNPAGGTPSVFGGGVQTPSACWRRRSRNDDNFFGTDDILASSFHRSYLYIKPR